MKKIIKIIFVLALCLFATGCGDKEKEKTFKEVTVIISSSGDEIYNEQVYTNKDTLFGLMEKLGVKMKYEDGDYGAYITSLLDIEQTSTAQGMHYWSYYINDEYANERHI